MRKHYSIEELMQKQWLTPAEAGKIAFDVCGPTVKKWIADGLIKAVKVGKKESHHKIELQEVLGYVERVKAESYKEAA